MHAYNTRAVARNSLSSNSVWKRVGTEWRLFHDRRTVGRVVPFANHPNMWRVKLPGGLSDLLNLSRARDAARAFSERRPFAAKTAEKGKRNQGAFLHPSSLVRLIASGLPKVRGAA
jgi:hypothetical protein